MPHSDILPARPDIARRLEIREAGLPSAPAFAVPEMDHGPVRLSDKGGGLPKRAERYLSGLTKLGSLYVTVKDILKTLRFVEVRIDAVQGDIQTLHHDRAAMAEAVEATGDTAEEARRIAGEAQDSAAALGEKMDSAAATLDERMAAATVPDNDDVDREIAFLRTELSETAARLEALMAVQAREQAGLSRAYGDLTRRIDLVQAGEGASLAAVRSAKDRPGLDALMESFYARLEDRFRGSREEIMRRLVKYVPDAEAAVARTGKPVLDLGCGRGEWLELLRMKGIEAVGVDLNEMQLRDAQALGLNARQGEAAAFMGEMADGAYGMVTAHHLAEHMPFADLVWLTREAMRVLAPGGVLVYETPNPANLIVGATNFHIDPTHVRPLPSQPLVTLFDVVGFDPVEARFLHPHEKQDRLPREGRLDPEVAGLLFGSQDLAVLGIKPVIAA